MHSSFGLSIGLLPVALGFSHLARDESLLKPNHFIWSPPGEDDGTASSIAD